MNRLLSFLVLISHMNFIMFIPQVEEIDLFNVQCVQEDDINSLYEYVDQIVLSGEDVSPEDEDDDTARYFYVTQVDQSPFHQLNIVLKNPAYSLPHKIDFPSDPNQKLPSLFSDIQSPPPKA
jgi:hypothetical protein